MRRVLGFILLAALLLVGPASMASAVERDGDQVRTTTTTTPIATYDPAANPAFGAASSWASEDSNVRAVIEPSGPFVVAEGMVSAPRQLDEAVGAFCSFAGTTAVLMADGSTKPLGDIEVGDWVQAEDPETGERGARQVTHVWSHNDTVTDLVVDGAVVTTTEDHPFWNATDREWQRADALDAGDQLLTADGTTFVVAGLDPRTATTTTAYNLTVEGVHTYFVAAGDDELLVHNTCDIPGRPFRGANAPQRAFDHLELNHGLDPHVASNRLHAIKQHFGIGAADDVVIGRTGDVYNAQTGDWLGMLTDSGWGR